jgi:hypothetical protein
MGIESTHSGGGVPRHQLLFSPALVLDLCSTGSYDLNSCPVFVEHYPCNVVHCKMIKCRPDRLSREMIMMTGPLTARDNNCEMHLT